MCSTTGLCTLVRLTKVDSHLVIKSADKDAIRNQTKARSIVSGDGLAVWGHFRGAGHAAVLIHTSACQLQYNTKQVKRL